MAMQNTASRRPKNVGYLAESVRDADYPGSPFGFRDIRSESIAQWMTEGLSLDNARTFDDVVQAIAGIPSLTCDQYDAIVDAAMDVMVRSQPPSGRAA